MTYRAFPVVIAGALALVVGLTGCTAPEAPKTPKPTPSATALPVPAPSGDGILRLGTMFPMTGDAAATGKAQVAGTEVALREITEQGGVLGKPLELVHRNSAGDLDVALTNLIARKVDVVLWDPAVKVPEAAVAALEAADIAILPLGDFMHDGKPIAPGNPFAKRLRSADPGLTGFVGGAEAFDGVVTAALAATVAGDDGGPSVASRLDFVASGPTACTSWGECLAALADKQEIRFVGATGERS
ncbi:amino acid ABC transporter substrate-binding protein [Cryobacterium sp. Sr8]|uniref:ABC transporter substrate-binding protein n=1 Tax=Cryobacterium sp. Sr8 TaxID=1259203 RepID=UPI00106D6154|nr:ABC transporter substrate-binding protein [Cryobacterium sp. Sr8]TFD75067.1 amino acid ABC transporter substrate-binding protein [Cryobacterium sp. Sr8]